MKSKNIILILCLTWFGKDLYPQMFPYDFPLKQAWSNDGINFQPPSTFQDSSGVPSLIKWKGDTIVCAFQWFREPVNGPSWDRIAIKFSYDSGLSWTQPTVANFLNYPPNFIRAFDPALLVLDDGSIRMYFSTKPGINQNLDSLVDTYSANSTDGINYTFNAAPIHGHPTKAVIDPSVIKFNNKIHYTAPVGPPQDGAYHVTSDTNDGIIFVQSPDYLSDNNHQWTGNYCKVNQDTLRFYGQTKLIPNNRKIWFLESVDALSWSPSFAYTNVEGGDNSVLRVGDNSYFMVYVGESYLTSMKEGIEREPEVLIFPNPAKNLIYFDSKVGFTHFVLYDSFGKIIKKGELELSEIEVNSIDEGIYFLKLENRDKFYFAKVVIGSK